MVIDVYYCERNLSHIMYCITTYLVFIGTRYYMTPATIDYFTIIITNNFLNQCHDTILKCKLIFKQLTSVLNICQYNQRSN